MLGARYSPVGVEEVVANSPTIFELAQNYPNPFNPSTTIKFSIPNNVETLRATSLRVYNSLGQQVSELLDKPLTAGNYRITFNVSNLTSGIYYRLTSGEFVATKKLVLLK